MRRSGRGGSNSSHEIEQAAYPTRCRHASAIECDSCDLAPPAPLQFLQPRTPDGERRTPNGGWQATPDVERRTPNGSRQAAPDVEPRTPNGSRQAAPDVEPRTPNGSRQATPD